MASSSASSAGRSGGSMFTQVPSLAQLSEDTTSRARLVCIKQTSPSQETVTRGGAEKRVHVVVKSASFLLQLGLVNNVLYNQVIDVRQFTVEAKLVYDTDGTDEKEVDFVKVKPLEYKSKLNDEGTQITLDCRIKVLTSQHEDMFFRVRVRLIDPSTGEVYSPAMVVRSEPIKVISKPEQLKKRQPNRQRTLTELIVESVNRIEATQLEHKNILEKCVAAAARGGGGGGGGGGGSNGGGGGSNGGGGGGLRGFQALGSSSLGRMDDSSTSVLSRSTFSNLSDSSQSGGGSGNWPAVTSSLFSSAASDRSSLDGSLASSLEHSRLLASGSRDVRGSGSMSAPPPLAQSGASGGAGGGGGGEDADDDSGLAALAGFSASSTPATDKEGFENPGAHFEAAFRRFLLVYNTLSPDEKPAKIRKLVRNASTKDQECCGAFIDLFSAEGLQRAASQAQVQQSRSACACVVCPYQKELERIDEFYEGFLSAPFGQAAGIDPMMGLGSLDVDGSSSLSMPIGDKEHEHSHMPM